MSEEVIRIQDFHGLQVDRTEAGYPSINQQYATSSYQTQHDMNPKLIVRPKLDQIQRDKDVAAAIKWARNKPAAVAIKSGGHQYSGASSTGGNNIQIDLTDTYKEFKVLGAGDPPVPADRTLVFIGVSVTMLELNGHLKANQLFVPTGQCGFVGVGGHGQTGGYGQLGRSFGLFGDHIRIVRIIDHDGRIQDVSKQSDAELFYAILGGSPGNFGVITHYVIEVYKSASYVGTVAGPGGFKGPHGIKALFMYTRETLVTLLKAVAKMADDPTTPRGFDLCVSVVSKGFDIPAMFPSLNDPAEWARVQTKIDYVFKDKPVLPQSPYHQLPVSAIIVYAQWCPTSPGDTYDASVDAWFDTFRQIKKANPEMVLQFDELVKNMDEMTGEWIMNKKREFDLPYIKRAYSTASTTLTRDGWADTAAGRIDLICKRVPVEGCKLVVQIQCFGGNESQFHANRNNGTSYSWRDTSVVQVLDCFHTPDEGSKERARVWQAENDRVMIGSNSVFSKQDRRFLWGSSGDWNMSNVWRYYYEDETKYQRLGRARGRADPNGTFTANPFAVMAIRSA